LDGFIDLSLLAEVAETRPAGEAIIYEASFAPFRLESSENAGVSVPEFKQSGRRLKAKAKDQFERDSALELKVEVQCIFSLKVLKGLERLSFNLAERNIRKAMPGRYEMTRHRLILLGWGNSGGPQIDAYFVEHSGRAPC
jgi:hypothetical protein